MECNPKVLWHALSGWGRGCDSPPIKWLLINSFAPLLRRNSTLTQTNKQQWPSVSFACRRSRKNPSFVTEIIARYVLISGHLLDQLPGDAPWMHVGLPNSTLLWMHAAFVHQHP